MNNLELEKEINKRLMKVPEVRRMMEAIMPRQASYRYYTRSGSKDRYFYTTKKINHKNNPRYVAGIYRYIKTKNIFKMVKRVGFAKKYKAINWAVKMKEKESLK